MTERTFDDRPAVRERTPLLLGLVGPSGTGKTFSALRLATGIQRVSGGEVFLIDTEARRSLHYAPDKGEQANPAKGKFKFHVVPCCEASPGGRRPHHHRARRARAWRAAASSTDTESKVKHGCTAIFGRGEHL